MANEYKKAAIFLSDLHLGNGGPLEDFYSDKEFGDLLTTLSYKFGQADLDLVLLGDTFDLWQIVPEEEWIETDPDNINLEMTPEDEAAKVVKAIRQHLVMFDELAEFLLEGEERKVWFVAGNHDHSLVDGTVQSEVRKALEMIGFPGQRVFFKNYFEDKILKIYAEHGSQFDHNNKYDEFKRIGSDLSDECRGYGFVRLFLNLLEGRDPGIENGPAEWYRIFEYLIQNRRYALLGTATKLFYKYRRYDEQPIKKISMGKKAARYITSTGQTADRPLIFPDAMLEDDDFDEDNYFSNNDDVENSFRELFHQNNLLVEPFRTAALDIVALKTNQRRPPGPARTPGKTFKDFLEVKIDDVIDSEQSGEEASLIHGSVDKPVAQKMYESDNYTLKDKRLDKQETRFVVMGHTHSPVDGEISNVLGGKFFNTGSWASGGGGLTDLRYVEITLDGTDELSAKLNSV
jgi:UDP-2,3-diacylglucosamine pyrophosphatase LpxH